METEKTNLILEAVKKGCTYKAAAAAGGIGTTTLYKWIHKGKHASRGKYREFYVALKKAELDRQQELLQVITSHAVKDWKAAAWILERRDGFIKGATWDVPEQETQEQKLPTTAKELFLKQAQDLQGAVASAMQAQSWQAYAALQRQLASVFAELRSIEAEESSVDALSRATDEQIKAEAVNAIIGMPPILRQEIVAEIMRFQNVVKISG